MQHLFSIHTSAHSNNWQTSVLLLLGFVFLTLAWLGMFHSFPIGVLLFGLGMLVAGLLKPRRFLSAGWLMTSLGVVTFLMFQHAIPDSQVLTAHLLAVGLGLLGIALMARRGFINAGALTPGFFVVGVGVTEYLQAVHLIPPPVIPFALSLWLPGLGLIALGLFSLAASGRTYPNALQNHS
jgi:hypothetical protein